MAVAEATLADLASILDLNKRTVQKYAASGVFVRVGHGKYAFGESIRNWARSVREEAAGRATSQESGMNLPDESARLKAAQRRNLELKNAQIERETVRLVDIHPVWARVILAVRSAMLVIPGKARLQIPHLTARDAEVLMKIIKDALRAAALTDTPPAIDVTEK